MRSPDVAAEVTLAGGQEGPGLESFDIPVISDENLCWITLTLWFCPCSLMPIGWWTQWVLSWVIPCVIKCDLITFAYVNWRYDRLTFCQTSLLYIVLIWPKREQRQCSLEDILLLHFIGTFCFRFKWQSWVYLLLWDIFLSFLAISSVSCNTYHNIKWFI